MGFLGQGRAVTVAAQLLIQLRRLIQAAGVFQQLGPHVFALLEALRAFLVIRQRGVQGLCASEGGDGAAFRQALRLLVIRLQGHLGGVPVVLQLQEGSLGPVIVLLLQGLLRLIVVVGRDAVEIHQVGAGQQQNQADQGDQGALDALAALLLLFLPGLLHAACLFPGGAGLFLHFAVQAEDHRFHRRLVEAGELGMLFPPAAQALGHAGGVGPAADADPHRPLVAGIAQGVLPGQAAQHIQLPGGGQAVFLVFAHLPGAPAPDGAIRKPHLFNDKVKAVGLFPVLHRHQHLKGAAGLPVQPLHPLHLALGLLSRFVKA